MTIKFLFAILGLLIVTQESIAKDWHGIVPLKSTRTEVERRFGKPDKWGDYKVGAEKVSFLYSGGSCADLYRALEKDNCKCLLANDTVLEITVEPITKRRFSETKIELSRFKRVAISPFPYSFAYYNPADGIDYTVDEAEDEIVTIDYYGTEADCNEIIKKQSTSVRNSWRGLTPLHATRRDVERLLGAPTRIWDTSARFETDHEVVTVKYSNGKCGECDTCWNVPRDTVVELIVGQRFGFLLRQLNLDPSRWERQEIFPFPEIANPPKVANYVNQFDGIIIRTESKASGDEVVVSITYQPAKRDAKLRCNNANEGTGMIPQSTTTKFTYEASQKFFRSTPLLKSLLL
jgi:hypothetical protein